MKNSLLFISADPPMPPTGGGTRAFHFVKAISEITRCNLFVLFPLKKNKLPSKIIDSCNEVHCSQTLFSSRSKGMFSGWMNDLRLLLAPWSFPKEQVILTAGYFITNPYEGKNLIRKVFLFFLKRILLSYVLGIYQKGFSLPAKTLERLAQFKESESSILEFVKKSDLLWIDFSSLLPLFHSAKKSNAAIKVICNAHNIEYKILERHASLLTNRQEERWYQSQAAVMRKAELEGFSNCDLIVTCSEEDRQEILNQLPGANVTVIPNGVDTHYFTPHNSLSDQPSLLFTGTMGYAPNREAIDYFIEKIFPLVVESHPTCTFVIAGANAGEVFAKYKSRKNIEIVSSPEDIRPVYDKAWIVVVPLLSGSGTRLKILEAMAMEKPVVSTSVGAEGLEVSDTIDLLIADTPNSLAERINTLIKEPETSKLRVDQAKKTVGKLYNWNRIEQMIKNEILEII
ncbi:MAG: glycosyltransferase family 4 protein [Ginsengibacter sp.]